MRYFHFFIPLFLTACAALPSKTERSDPALAKHKHMQSTNYFAGVTPFKPVPAGDWRALNRNVAPDEKKQ